MVVVDPKTGYIKCMVGGYDYNADENHVNHATAKRPVGSTFKPLRWQLPSKTA